MNENIPRCQQIHNEYKDNLTHLREIIHAIKSDELINIDGFIRCMEFVYREGWGDCFSWNGEISGSQTLEEFLEILPIERYGR